jgi:pimeloyl-ACP methyl ester carboxylesterase
VHEEGVELRPGPQAETEGELSVIPVSVFRPEAAPRGVVLLGHGLGADRTHPSVRLPAELLVERFGLAAVAPDLPRHGARSERAAGPGGVADAWQTFWTSGGPAALRDEWLRILGFARERFAGARVGYFGLALATHYGVVFLANAPQVAAAVLGLFGCEPAPKSAILHACAPRVRCPVHFVQKLDDELVPRSNSDRLYELLGSDDRALDASPGRHGDVTPEGVARACAFLAQRLAAG